MKKLLLTTKSKVTSEWRMVDTEKYEDRSRVATSRAYRAYMEVEIMIYTDTEHCWVKDLRAGDIPIPMK